MEKKMTNGAAIIAGVAALALGGVAYGNSEKSLTFDLSQYFIGDPDPNANTLTATAPNNGQVKTVVWDINYQAGAGVGSSSWGSELNMQLIAPGAASNGYTNSGFGTAPGGWYPGIGNAGTFVWGTPNTWAAGFNPGGAPNSHNFGFPDSSTGTNLSAGSTNAFTGMAAMGTWTLILSDSYNDAFLNGVFGAGSYVTIYYTPTPGALAVLGLAGVAGLRRRR